MGSKASTHSVLATGPAFCPSGLLEPQVPSGDLGLFLSLGWASSERDLILTAPRYTQALGSHPDGASVTVCLGMVGAWCSHYVGAEQGAWTWGSQGSPTTNGMGWEPSASISPGKTVQRPELYPGQAVGTCESPWPPWTVPARSALFSGIPTHTGHLAP